MTRPKRILRQRAKRGLPGDTGFVSPDLHISATYGAADDEVFVVARTFSADEEFWCRMTHSQAKAVRVKPIECSWFCGKAKRRCHRPAKTLDHYWPHMTSACCCDKHRDFKKYPLQD